MPESCTLSALGGRSPVACAVAPPATPNPIPPLALRGLLFGLFFEICAGAALYIASSIWIGVMARH